METWKSREDVKKIRETYPVGSAVVLDHCRSNFMDIKDGMRGKVLDVDDIGMIHVLFENGSQLGLLVGMDKFHIETSEDFIRPEWKRSCYCLGSFDFHDLLKRVYPDVKAIVLHLDMDGLWVSSDADDEWGPTDEELCEKIGQYLGVRVTSIHIYDCYEPGIWIVYTK